MHEIIVTYRWKQDCWTPAHQIVKLDLPYRYIGHSGDVRDRELARNDCPEKLQKEVDRAEGRAIGLDPRFAYFRYRPTQRKFTRQEIEESRRANIE